MAVYGAKRDDRSIVHHTFPAKSCKFHWVMRKIDRDRTFPATHFNMWPYGVIAHHWRVLYIIMLYITNKQACSCIFCSTTTRTVCWNCCNSIPTPISFWHSATRIDSNSTNLIIQNCARFQTVQFRIPFQLI